MNEREAHDLVQKTFENSFDRNQFGVFIEDLLKRHSLSEDRAVFTVDNNFALSGTYVRHAFKEYINKYERVGQFTDVNGEKIDILVVYLHKFTSLERGRKMLRSFAEDYLKSDRGRDKSAVLVANVSPDENDWRFSFVKLDIKRRKDDAGKVRDVIDYRVPAKRFSFLVGENEFSHTAQKQFAELLKSQSSPTFAQIEKAFDIEKVTKDFYLEYEKLFEDVRDEIIKIRKKDKALNAHLEEKCIDSEDFAKKLLGQILFLYFLQKKGWFGVKRKQDWGEGDKKYISGLFTRKEEIYRSLDQTEIELPTFFNDILEPLFYEALAVDRRDNADYYSRFQSRIPFLNGGLFEASYTWYDYRIPLPDRLFWNQTKNKEGEIGTGIFNVFDRFNFTVHEAEPLETEVAIDPEMLGNVFENLLLKEERGRSGTFYTPRLIVNYMCRQSLLDYLSTKLLDENVQQKLNGKALSREDLENFISYADQYAAYEVRKVEDGVEKEIKKYKLRQFPASVKEAAPDIDHHLAEVKVCDPAIGSGAFPVGMMQEIVRLRKSLITTGKVKNQKDYELKLHTIQNSIYGVDISQSAVDIARLRLWLSLIVDEKDRDQIEVLPNLDYKIMQGNSLIDEFEGEKLLPEDFIKRNASRNLALIENKEAIRNRLQSEYFEQVRLEGKNSIKAKQIFRDIDDLNNQLLKEKNKDAAKAAQENLLELNTERSRKRLKELHELHRKIFKTKTTEEKSKLRREVDLKILEFIQETLDERERNLQDELSNIQMQLDADIKYEREVRGKDTETATIARTKKLIEGVEARLAHLESVRFELRHLWQNKPDDDSEDLTDIDNQNFTPFKAKPFFLWETQFPEMFFDEEGGPLENGGFDVVIANPPYIRQEKIKEYKAALQRRFPEVYSGTADILVYFYAQGVSILRQGGTLTFITSNKYFRTGYGAGLRETLGSEMSINQIIDFGDAPVFEAAAYASIILLRKEVNFSNKTRVWTFPQNESVEDFVEEFYKHGFYLPQFELQKTGWLLEPEHVLQLLRKILAAGSPLGEYVADNFFRGIITGFNEAFVIDFETKKRLVAEDRSSAEIIKPFLRGRDIKRWKIDSQNMWLIFTKHGTDIDKYPAIKNYLSQFKKHLMPTGKKDPKTGKALSRKIGSYKWYEIQDNIAYWQEFSKSKIIYPNICSRNEFAWDEEEFFTNQKAFIIPDATKFLLGYLNSSIVFWLFDKLLTKLMHGFFEPSAIYMREIPIPDAEDWQKEIVEKFVDYVLFLSKSESGSLIVSYFESIINAMVYELFLKDDLQEAEKYFFEPLSKEKLPLLEEIKGKEVETIKKIFERLSDTNHIIRKNLYFLDNIESVRIIEGKQ